MTGIGHDKDISVTDMVAFQSFKTPTAVADYLIESFMEIEGKLNFIWFVNQRDSEQTDKRGETILKRSNI